MSTVYHTMNEALTRKEKRLRILSLFMSLSCFGVGSLVYLLFRTTELYLFIPLKIFGGYEIIIALRKFLVGVTLPEWIIYSSADGLWLFAYMLLIETIWWSDGGYWKTVFLYSLPAYALVVEIGQMFHYFFGTGDWFDVIAYIIAIFLFIIFKKQKIMNKTKIFLSSVALVAFVVAALACKSSDSALGTNNYGDQGSGKDGAQIEVPATDNIQNQLFGNTNGQL